MLELGQAGAARRHLAEIKLFRGDEDPDLAHLQPRLDRTGTEGGEKRAEHRAGLPDPQGGDVELGHPIHQHRDGIAGRQPQAGQNGRGAPRQIGQLMIGDIAPFLTAAQPPHRHVIAPAGGQMAISTGGGDVQAALGRPAQLHQRLIPGE